MAFETSPKIGYVLKVFPRLSQTFVVNELVALEHAGCDIMIFSLKRPRREDTMLAEYRLQSPVVYLEGPPENWADELAHLVEQHKIKRMHAHFGNVAAETARLASAKTGVPYSFTAHALDIFDEKVKEDELRRKILESDGVVTVSQFNARHLRKVFGRRPVVIHNGMPIGINSELTPIFPVERDAISEKRGTLPTILAVGRLIEKKGFHVLIDACAELVSREFPFRCRIIGYGPLQQDLGRQIADRKLENQVELSGTAAPGVVKQELRQATLLAAPCVIAGSGDRDGMPTVLLEAMALGTPCISTDVTGIPEIVQHRMTGLTVRQNDAVSLADACQELIQDRKLAQSLAVNARQMIEKDFDSIRSSAALRGVWNRPPRRILFRIHNRRGMGHWMRCLNMAKEILRISPHTDLLFYSRSKPPFSVDDTIRCEVSANPDQFGLDASLLKDFAPHVVVDDTILKEFTVATDARRILVMRKMNRQKQQEMFDGDLIESMDLMLVPHTPEEFAYPVPERLKNRTIFTGPIVRQADTASMQQMRQKYGLGARDFLLVSSPGGGGFPNDTVRFFEVVEELHRQLTLARLRHIVVCGPNSSATVSPVDERMTVVQCEPELVSLFALARAAIAAGGYNSVNEIRVAKCPAFFLPGNRKYDDQHERVEEMRRLGLARTFPGSEPATIACEIAKRLNDETELRQMASHYAKDRVACGNFLSAKAILSCAYQ